MLPLLLIKDQNLALPLIVFKVYPEIVMDSFLQPANFVHSASTKLAVQEELEALIRGDP